MTRRRSTRVLCAVRCTGVGLLMGIVWTVAGCSGTRPAPVAGDTMSPPPNLRGTRVMVFPVQGLEGLTGQVDAELAFALEGRGEGVDWVLPDELRRALRASPGLDAPLEGLPVGVFLRTEVERVGDPLFGVLIRLSAVTDADLAMIPVLVRYRRGVDASAGTAEIATAILDAGSGRVYWFGIVEGSPGAADDPAVLATAMDALATMLTGG